MVPNFGSARSLVACSVGRSFSDQTDDLSPSTYQHLQRRSCQPKQTQVVSLQYHVCFCSASFFRQDIFGKPNHIENLHSSCQLNKMISCTEHKHILTIKEITRLITLLT
jgi:hypothetical protein